MTTEQWYKIKNTEHRSHRLVIHYDDQWLRVQFYPEHRKKIKDRGHCKAIQRQFKSKDIKIGDIVYKKLKWSQDSISFAQDNNPATGCAIERDGVIISYSMPIKAKSIEETRIVLFEKTQKVYKRNYDLSEFLKQHFRDALIQFRVIRAGHNFLGD